MLYMGGEQIEEAVTHAAKVLRTAAERDWSVKAGGSDWSCLKTAEHIAGCLVAYAGQLTGRATDTWVPFEVAFDEGSGPADAISVLEATGGLLAAVVRTTPPGVRAYHPYPSGSADAVGFAAMGVAEVLLHTYDIARALGVDAEPPAALCEAVLARLFPQVTPARTPGDQWATLLWATGRGVLPGRPKVESWRWHNALSIPAGRVVLREVTPAAAVDLAAGGTGGFTWIEGGPYEGTRSAAEMVTKAYASGVHRPEWGMFVLVRAQDEVAVGGMGFHGPPDEEGVAEVGYDLAPAARGRGYASEALRTLSSLALERPGVAALLALTEPENSASGAVATRAGYAPAPNRENLRAYVRPA
ncbi:GNAT family N-acetyltransferase [Streptomyces longisporoflavus]|uniref:GNAT family N-acetyltransferase n=1 Tax=Streptomyces longisporoflavus TaxID=28044 RepID=A0ABW7R000_9ACTN